jgi:hypothetical protein
VTGRLWLVNTKRERVKARQRADDSARQQAPLPPVGNGFYFAGALSSPNDSASPPAATPIPTERSAEPPNRSLHILNALEWATAAASLAGAVILAFHLVGWRVPPGIVLAVAATAASLTLTLRRRRQAEGDNG